MDRALLRCVSKRGRGPRFLERLFLTEKSACTRAHCCYTSDRLLRKPRVHRYDVLYASMERRNALLALCWMLPRRCALRSSQL